MVILYSTGSLFHCMFMNSIACEYIGHKDNHKAYALHKKMISKKTFFDQHKKYCLLDLLVTGNMVINNVCLTL